jgi:hypothetical protein
MRRLAAVAFVLAVGGLTGVAQADDKSGGPSGTWKWSAPGRPGGGRGARENTLKLKVDGDKVTGTISAREGEVAIEDGKYKNGEVSFAVTITSPSGQSMTRKFHGKVSGDEIRGKIEGARGQPRDWVAKRAK